jgi:hypothetical protein
MGIADHQLDSLLHLGRQVAHGVDVIGESGRVYHLVTAVSELPSSDVVLTICVAVEVDVPIAAALHLLPSTR